ncbi:hypothetical protein BH23ACT11_BH23ACT11_28780 [soil metagenome]
MPVGDLQIPIIGKEVIILCWWYLTHLSPRLSLV